MRVLTRKSIRPGDAATIIASGVGAVVIQQTKRAAITKQFLAVITLVGTIHSTIPKLVHGEQAGAKKRVTGMTDVVAITATTKTTLCTCTNGRSHFCLVSVPVPKEETVFQSNGAAIFARYAEGGLKNKA